MRLVSRFKAGPVELEWKHTLDDAATEVAVESATQSQSHTRDEPTGTELDLADVHPLAAMIRAYNRIEVALYNSLETADALPARRAGRVPWRQLLQAAVRVGLLPEPLAAAAEDLRQVRNEVVHSADVTKVTTGQATQYVLVADEIIAALDAAVERQGPP